MNVTAHGAPQVSGSMRILLATVTLIAVLSLTLSYFNTRALGHTREQVADTMLATIATLLKDNASLLKELEAEESAEGHSEVLVAYLNLIRHDGVPKHADMKQRLDQLAENNTAIVTLIQAYAPQAKTPAFTAGADKFRNYASAWRDRWNSVLELFMAGGNYVASSLPFPTDFPQAVQAEIAAAR